MTQSLGLINKFLLLDDPYYCGEYFFYEIITGGGLGSGGRVGNRL